MTSLRARLCSLGLSWSVVLGASTGCGTSPSDADGGPSDAAASRDAGVDAGRDAGPDGGPPTEPWFDPPMDPAPPAIAWLDDGEPPVAPPDIPWLADGAPPVAPPSATCPPGWRATSLGSTATCHPYPASGPATCPGGQAHFPGGTGCEPLGDACPSGGALYSPALPTTGLPIIYVRAGATGGSGTLADPYGRVDTAIAAAPSSGAIVALSTGTFAEPVTLAPNVTVFGACAQLTIVAPAPVTLGEAVVMHTSGTASLANLTLRGTRPGVVATGAGVTLTLHGVHLLRTALAALNVSAGATVTGDEVRISETLGSPLTVPPFSVDQYGHAIDSSGAAQINLRRVVMDANHAFGVIVANAGTLVHLEDASIRGTLPQVSDGSLGQGAFLYGGRLEMVRGHIGDSHGGAVTLIDTGGSVSLTDVVIEETRADGTYEVGGNAIYAYGSTVEGDRVWIDDSTEYGLFLETGTTATLRDVVVHATTPLPDGTRGGGVFVDGTSDLTLERAVVSDNLEVGIFVNGGMLDATDLLATGNSGNTAGRGGDGLTLGAGSTVGLTRALFDGNQQVGVAARGVGTTLTMADVAFVGTRTEADDGSEGMGLLLGSGAHATLVRGLADRNVRFGISLNGDGSTLDGSDVVVRQTGSSPDGTHGHGVRVDPGTTTTLERVLVSGNRELGVGVVGGTLTLSDAVVEDTAPNADDRLGEGVGVQQGGTLHLERAIVRRNLRSGLYAFGEGSHVELADVLVADTDSETASGLSGLGAVIQLGATGSLDRVVFDRNRHMGLAVGATSVVDARDIVVRDSRSIVATGDGGRGIGVSSASFTLERARVERCREVGFGAFGPDSVLTLSDLAVIDTELAETSGTGGQGVILSGVTGEIHRVHVERASSTAVTVTEGSSLTLSDLTVLDTRPDTGGNGGRGFNVQNASTVTLTRALVEGSREVGVFVDTLGSEATLEQIVVRGTESRAADHRFGAGLYVQLGAHATVRDGIFDANRYLGVGAIGTAEIGSPDLVLEDVVVYGTRQAECAEEGDGCPSAAGGIGVASYVLATLRATRFTSSANELCGVQVTGDAELDLREGVVTGNAIGACVQSDGYDLDRLSEGVIYRFNDQNLQATELPVPDVAASLSDLPGAPDL